jgi:hypothetical protein
MMKKLSKKLYTIDVVNDSIRDFKSVCDIDLFDLDGYYVLHFSLIQKSSDLNIVEDEFCNYCIGLMK